MFRRLFVLVCVVFCAVLLGPPAAHAAQPHRWIMLSDLHFDPFADPRIVNRLAAAPVERWRAMFTAGGSMPYANYGSDTNAPLLEATLEGVRNVVEQPDGLIVAGDFLAHDFRGKFDRTASRHDDAAYAAFVDKTMRFMAFEFHAAFPRSVVYPVIGNNDNYCGDYQSTPDSPFLASMAAAWAPLLGMDVTARAAFTAQFAHGGYYVVDGPIPHIRIIALNDVFWSANYRNACGDAKANPGAEELSWLNGQLKTLPAGRSAWIVAHVPPGVDVYTTMHDKTAGAVDLFLADAFNDPYVYLIQNPDNRIAHVWSGHTHMNDYRVVNNPLSTYTVPLQIVPSVSPVFSNNPSFVVAEFDTSTGSTIGEQTYVLDDLSALARYGGRTPHWRREFDFAQAFNDGEPDATGYTRLHDGTFLDTARRLKFSGFYDGESGRVPIPESQWRAYWCAQVALTAASYRGCAIPQVQASLPPQPSVRRVQAPPERTVVPASTPPAQSPSP